MAQEVRDHLSNAPEHLEEAAKALGGGQRVEVFKAIYRGKKKIKTVSEIMRATGLDRVRVLQRAGELAGKGIVEQTRVDGETAYKTIRFFQVNKSKVLRYNRDSKALQKLPTKRRVKFLDKLPSSVSVPTAGAKVRRITIDDIDSFSAVRRTPVGDFLPPDMSEDEFKNGVARILGERGRFKDWGGENSDLYSTRVKIKGRRLAAAFAFKGPGLRSKLVPGKMGKNGDQAQRMFRQDADIFLVQHWREIDDSVLELMRALAVSRSQTTGQKVYYGIIDGQDSDRLRRAYPGKFT
jgi:DNA-binding transcriptional ArsR family regulator